MSAAASGWLAPLRHWPQTAVESLSQHRAVARIVIASVRGSAPREAGTCMLVDGQAIYGTIGGGQLEWAAMAAARELLEDGPSVRISKLVLGAELAQCCGGVVELWIERYTRVDLALLQSISKSMETGRGTLVSTLQEGHVERRIDEAPIAASSCRVHYEAGAARAELREPLNLPSTPLWLYGAGHVAQALVRVLDPLPFAITWIDARPALLPECVSPAVQVMVTPDPLATVRLAPSNAVFLVMTHSHPLDYALCHAVLTREDAAWLGLIGSQSKAARFRSRLAAAGLSPRQIDRLTSPIGIAGIESKLPAAIAIAIAAQLLERQGTFTQSIATRDLIEVAPSCGGCKQASRGC